MLGGLISGGLGILGGLFGNKEQKKLLKEIRKLTKDVRTKYLPEYTGRTYKSADEMSASLLPFYDQYMKEGSPLLAQRQRAAYENVVQQGERASGNLQQKLTQTGYGFTPSGLFAAAQGDLARSTAKSAADAYLENLLQNEMFRFQAATGKGDVYKTLLQTFNPGVWSSFIPGAPQSAGTDWASVGRGVADIFGAFKKPAGSTNPAPTKAVSSGTPPVIFNPGGYA